MPGSPLNACRDDGNEPAPWAEYVLGSDMLEVRHALEALAADLRARLPRDLTLFELVLAEVLNNIVEHAYGPDQNGEIRIEILDAGRKVTVRTVDQGRQMPGLQLPEGKLPDLDVETDLLPEGGFGWFIFHSSTLDVSYDRNGDENHLQYSMELNA